MGFKDVRSFLQKLDEEGQLIKYDKQVKLSPEWYDMVRALPRMGQYGPALITDKLEGYTGQRIAVGLQASAANCAVMLGLPKSCIVTRDKKFNDWVNRLHIPPSAPRIGRCKKITGQPQLPCNFL